MLSQVAGVPCSLADAPLAISSTIVPRTAIPSTHPVRKAGPFVRPLGVASISTTAMIGTGLSATPTPNERTCPIVWPVSESSPDRCPPTHHLPRRLGAYHPIRMKGTHIRRAGTSTAAPPGTAETLGDRDLSPYVWESLATDAHVGARQLWNRSKGQRAFA